MKLILEMNKTFDSGRYAASFGIIEGVGALVTPDIDESYWLMRVPVSQKQAIVCFPKFGTIGIAFQVEEDDWNTNLPHSCDAAKIYEHIRRNKGQRHIKASTCITAIRMLQMAIVQLKSADQQAKA